MTSRRLGKLPPRCSFVLNRHEDLRLRKCPKCDQPTRLRKFVLAIQVDGFGLMALAKTGRFSPGCDLLTVDQDELEHEELTIAFETRTPNLFGND